MLAFQRTPSATCCASKSWKTKDTSYLGASAGSRLSATAMPRALSAPAGQRPHHHRHVHRRARDGIRGGPGRSTAVGIGDVLTTARTSRAQDTSRNHRRPLTRGYVIWTLLLMGCLEPLLA